MTVFWPLTSAGALVTGVQLAEVSELFIGRRNGEQA
jgi:hypothetical protein